MFGNTSLIMGSDRIVRERLGSSGLADFVRLEFRLEDQPSVMFSLRRAAVKERRGRPAHGVVRRFRSWRATTRALDRKSTRLNSSHQIISYAVFCLKKKKKKKNKRTIS